MSNILERHLEENINPNTSKQSYIDQAIQIFQDMKKEDITLDWLSYKDENDKYCLCGIFSRMTGWKSNEENDLLFVDVTGKLGTDARIGLTGIHTRYCNGRISFEQMRKEAIEYMESLKRS